MSWQQLKEDLKRELKERVESINETNPVTNQPDPTFDLANEALAVAISGYTDNGVWSIPIDSKYDPSVSLPSTPTEGDRHIATATANGWTENYIYEYDGSSWVEAEPFEGQTLFDLDTDTHNYWNGTQWSALSGSGGLVPHASSHGNGGSDEIAIDWSQITTGVPVYAERWPSWSEVSDKPTTFAPSAHASSHGNGGSDEIAIDWSQITTGVPAYATRWPNASEVGSLTEYIADRCSEFIIEDPSKPGISIVYNDLGHELKIGLDHLSLQDLTAPAGDRIYFYDKSADKSEWLSVGSGLSLTDTSLSLSAHASTHASGGGDPLALDWSQITTGIPSSFTPSAHASSHGFGESDPIAIDWSQITTGIPSSFTPSTHASTHASGGTDEIAIDWSQIASGVPVYATRWPSWTEVTNKPTDIVYGDNITDANEGHYTLVRGNNRIDVALLRDVLDGSTWYTEVWSRLRLITVDSNASSNKVMVLGTSNEPEQRNIDTRVWGSSLLSGSLTTNKMPKATGANTLGNSIVSAGPNDITITSANTRQAYQIQMRNEYGSNLIRSYLGQYAGYTWLSNNRYFDGYWKANVSTEAGCRYIQHKNGYHQWSHFPADSNTSVIDFTINGPSGYVSCPLGFRLGANSISNNGTGGLTFDTDGDATQTGDLIITGHLGLGVAPLNKIHIHNTSTSGESWIQITNGTSTANTSTDGCRIGNEHRLYNGVDATLDLRLEANEYAGNIILDANEVRALGTLQVLNTIYSNSADLVLQAGATDGATNAGIDMNVTNGGNTYSVLKISETTGATRFTPNGVNIRAIIDDDGIKIATGGLVVSSNTSVPDPGNGNLVVGGTATLATVDVNGGAIDGTPIGAASASTGAFTTLAASLGATIGQSLTVTGSIRTHNAYEIRDNGDTSWVNVLSIDTGDNTVINAKSSSDRISFALGESSTGVWVDSDGLTVNTGILDVNGTCELNDVHMGANSISNNGTGGLTFDTAGEVILYSHLIIPGAIKEANDSSSLTMYGGTANDKGPGIELYARDHASLAGNAYISFGGYDGTGTLYFRHRGTSAFSTALALGSSGNATFYGNILLGSNSISNDGTGGLTFDADGSVSMSGALTAASLNLNGRLSISNSDDTKGSLVFTGGAAGQTHRLWEVTDGTSQSYGYYLRYTGALTGDNNALELHSHSGDLLYKAYQTSGKFHIPGLFSTGVYKEVSYGIGNNALTVDHNYIRVTGVDSGGATSITPVSNDTTKGSWFFLENTSGSGFSMYLDSLGISRSISVNGGENLILFNIGGGNWYYEKLS